MNYATALARIAELGYLRGEARRTWNEAAEKRYHLELVSLTRQILERINGAKEILDAALRENH